LVHHTYSAMPSQWMCDRVVAAELDR
jgi:hypothetical protein